MATVVWVAEVPWNGIRQRQHRLAAQLARRWAVLYVEPAAPLRLPRAKSVERDGVRVAQVAPLINTSRRAVWPLLRSPTTRDAVSRLVSMQLRKLITRALPRVQTSELIIVCSNVFLIEAALCLRPRLLVADICDDPRAFDGAPPWTCELLMRCARSADVVTTSALALGAVLRGLGAQSVHFVPNGVPAEFLGVARQPMPGATVLGYLGTIASWFDFDLVNRLAAGLPEYVVRLIGPVDAAVRREADQLQNAANVHITGPVESDHVPRVLAEFSVGLIPFRRTPLTWAVNANKLYEYAALDLPIVATAFGPDVARFSPEVDVCDTPEAFIRAARDRAAGISVKSTRRIAVQHTWEAIGERFVELVSRAAGQD